VREDQRFLSRRRIDVVVTDGDAPGLHAARYERIPCVAIGHGLLFNNAEVGRLPLVPKVYERFNAASSCWLAQRKVAVHFLHGVSNDRNTVIARPNLTHLPGPALTGVRPFVVAYFRDRNGFRVMSQALAQGLDVRYFGASEDAPTGALVQSFCSDGFLRAMRGCSGVLTSSGSNVLSEAIALGKPILACFRKNDHEQRMNAILVDRARLGRALCLDRELVTTTNDFIQGMQERRFARYELHSMLPSVNECVVRACEELAGLGPEVGVSASVAHVA
jgi:UDP:flavonoid glycosyltransferase YjiC (YdhE family)